MLRKKNITENQRSRNKHTRAICFLIQQIPIQSDDKSACQFNKFTFLSFLIWNTYRLSTVIFSLCEYLHCSNCNNNCPCFCLSLHCRFIPSETPSRSDRRKLACEGQIWSFRKSGTASRNREDSGIVSHNAPHNTRYAQGADNCALCELCKNLYTVFSTKLAGCITVVC